MATWMEAGVAHSEVWICIPNTHVRWLTTGCNSGPKASDFLGFCSHPHRCAHTHRDTFTEIKISLKSKKRQGLVTKIWHLYKVAPRGFLEELGH